MEVIDFFVNLISDPRGVIAGWITTFGSIWVYTPLFLVIFIETGIVFFPFLPGDSLLFAAGVFSADGGGLNLAVSLIVFYVAAILGNTSNYWIARFFGKRILDSGRIKSLTPERMGQLDHFFDKYGGATIIITRFMPFLRTFAPFIAGCGHMNFAKFTLFNSIGGVSWVSLFVLVGYFFGGIPFIQNHFSLIVLGIVAVSVIPAIVGAIRGLISARGHKETQVERGNNSDDNSDDAANVAYTFEAGLNNEASDELGSRTTDAHEQISSKAEAVAEPEAEAESEAVAESEGSKSREHYG